MQRILFGTAGTPLSSKGRDSVSGIQRVRELGLDCMELEFVHGVKMGRETADLVRKTAEKEKVSLSVHAPYYINLNSVEKPKVKASIQRVLDSLKVGSWCGATMIAVHAGYYMKQSPQQTFAHIKTALEEIVQKAREEKYSCKLGIETMGRIASFGSVDEVLSLSEQVPGVFPYIDFSHSHARSNGLFTKKEKFVEVLEKIEKADSKFLKDLHMHVSGIEFSEKGERNHLMLQDKKNTFNWKGLLETLNEWKVQGALVCESPDMEKDALLMQKYFSSL